MKIALELDNNKIIIGTVYIANENYTSLLETEDKFILADIDNLEDIVEYKTKYEDGDLIPLEDYCQEWYEKQEKAEQRAGIQGWLTAFENWFNEYDMQVKQYERDVRLGEVGTYHIGDNEYTIEELDQEARTKAQQIRDLREQLKNLE